MNSNGMGRHGGKRRNAGGLPPDGRHGQAFARPAGLPLAAALALALTLGACGRQDPSDLLPESLNPGEGFRVERYLGLPKAVARAEPELVSYLYDASSSDGLFYRRPKDSSLPLAPGFARARGHRPLDIAGIVVREGGGGALVRALREGTAAPDASGASGDGHLALEGEGHLAWTNAGDAAHPDWRLHLDGIPLDGVQVRGRAEGGAMTYAQGNVPLGLAAGARSEDRHRRLRVERFGIDAARAREAVAWNLNFHPWRVSLPEKVWVVTRGALIPGFRAQIDNAPDKPGRGPAWPLEVLLDGRTGELLEQKPLAFHVDGRAMLYDENAVVSTEGSRETWLPSLAGDGSRLTGALFAVRSCDQKEASDACEQLATGPAGDFRSISYNEKEIDEVVAYHAVSKSMDWYRRVMSLKPATARSWGVGYGGTRASFGLGASLGLTVYVRSLTKTDKGFTSDNAAYMPSALKAGGTAKIIIGTGWEEGQAGENERLLRYLGRDTDVVMHEFGHHVIYRTLRDVSGQGGALHEGLADFFTYAITGNNKLGESIVAVGESLRAGTKQGKVDAYVGAKPHRAGEYFSSVMWELREALGPWQDGVYVLDKIAWEAVDLFKENAGYYDVVSALAKSAEAFAKQEKRSANELKNEIFLVFHKRGFIEAPDGSGTLPKPTSTISYSYEEPTPVDESGVNVDENRKGSSGWCGAVAGVADGSGGTPWALLALLALPLALPLIQRAKAGPRRR